MAHHGLETLVDRSLLAPSDFVHRRLHVVVDTAFRYPAKRLEGVIMGIEQHLVALREVGPQEKGAAVTETKVGNLQLGVGSVDNCVVLAPVKLERLTGCEGLGRIGVLCRSALGLLLFLAPVAGKGRHPVVGAGIAQLHQVAVQLLEVLALLAVPPALAEQPTGQGQLVVIQFGRTLALGIAGFNHATGQVLAYRIAAEGGSPGNLPDRHTLTEMPASDYA